MLTHNIDIADKLVNGSIGTIKKLHFNPDYPLLGVIFLKLDDPKAGNKLKDSRYRGELKECVPISPIVTPFSYTKGKTVLTVQRKQFPGILCHAMTIHKSQGSTLEYMRGDLDRISYKKKLSGKACKTIPVNQGLVYTMLSRAKSRDKIQVLNFEPELIRVNENALVEMNRMRDESTFSWKHPLMEMTGSKMCLFNIRSWHAHIEHFLSDKVYTKCGNVFCFTETHVNDRPLNHIDKYEVGWNDIHKRTEHGLDICYKSNKVKIIQEFQTITALEILPILMEVENE